MKTKHPEISWDDLIFENRNKEYGAYELRQKYKQVLSLSLFFSLLLSFALAFFFHVQAVNRQMTEYREMFQFISTPIDLSELKNYQQSENLNQKSNCKNQDSSNKNYRFAYRRHGCRKSESKT